ncbi:MAG: glycosyltransferase family 4 protein [Bacteroidota bacterium]
MKIGIEAQRIFRERKHGIDIVAIELIKALQILDTENEYYIFCNAKNADIENIFLDVPPNFHFIQRSSSNYATWEQIYLPQLAKEYDLDLLHCTANTAPLKLETPLVLTLHDIIYLERYVFREGSLYQRIGNLYRRFIVPRIIEKCTKIGTVSNFEKDKIESYFKISDSKLRTYHNACSDYFEVVEDETIISNFLQENRFPKKYIMLFGSKDPRKNTENSILAYADYARSTPTEEVVPLVIVDIELDYFKAIVRRNKLDDLVQFITTTQYVSNYDLKYIYNGAILFLFLSTRESFGIPVLEAMACGTPVLTSTMSSLPEVGGDAAIFVNPLNIQDISKNIKSIIGCKEERLRLAEKGLKRSKDFSWKLTAEKWLKTYQSFSPQKKMANK